MKKTTFTRLLSCFVCIVLIAAMALFTASCSDNSEKETPQVGNDSETLSGTQEAEATDNPDSDGVTLLGEGERQFDFIVRYADKSEDRFVINTDATFVGQALLDLGLIEGEDGPYGLYIKKVNGVTADFDIDGTYWSFYIDGEYAMTGADATEITEGASYMFAVEG